MAVNVLITGGTGSLGQALVRRFMASDEIADIIVYSRDEVKQSQMRREFPDVHFMLGDVRDYDRLMLATRHQDMVVHAAAYKQVPSAEANVDEAIATNVTGSLNVARACVLNNVGTVVGISTDKACMPVNAYGATKSLMEKLFQQADGWFGNTGTVFNLVRYGNVLGSRGSVVPLFREQLRRQEITFTNPAMTRFWMTLNQAVDLVWTGLMGNVYNGAILVPQCPASDMWTLLNAVARSEGIEPRDEWIRLIGTRPGEKLHEQLLHRNESLHTVQPSKHMPYYQILPATEMPEKPSAPFEYTSIRAYQLSVDELFAMVNERDSYA